MKLKRSNKGVSGIEFSLLLPVLALLVFGMVETVRYVMVYYKTNNASRTLSDLIARSDGINESEVNEIISATSHILDPFDFNNDTHVIISSVSADGVGTTINWSRTSNTYFNAPTRLAVNNEIVLPNNFTLTPGENIIVAEVFHNFSTFIAPDIFGNQLIYSARLTRPRLGGLDNTPSQPD